MIQKIIKYFNQGSVFYGLEICQIENESHYHLLEVQRKNEELFISDQYTDQSLESILSKVKNGNPVFLTINSNSVLTKIMELSPNSSPETIVNNAFPNLNFDSFYFELVVQKKSNIVSVLKREHIDTILRKMSELNILVVGFTLGISQIGSLLQYFQKKTIVISKNELLLSSSNILENNILPIKTYQLSNNYIINKLNIDGKQVLNLAGIIASISGNPISTTNFNNSLSFLNSEYKNKRHFKLILYSSLSFILGILLINFLFFNYYYKKVEDLKTTSHLNNVSKEKLIDIKERVLIKENRLKAVKSNNNSKTSFYLDNISITTPSSILLKKIDFQPLLVPIRKDKEIKVLEHIIVIEGLVSNSADFSIWLEKLEAFKWVKNIETMGFDYENTKNSIFSIKLFINDK